MSSRPHSIYVEDRLWDFLVGHAAKRGQSVAALINQSLREGLGFDGPIRTAEVPPEDPPFGEGGTPKAEYVKRTPTVAKMPGIRPEGWKDPRRQRQ